MHEIIVQIFDLLSSRDELVSVAEIARQIQSNTSTVKGALDLIATIQSRPRIEVAKAATTTFAKVSK